MELAEKILDVIRGTPAVRHMMLKGFDDLMLVGGARADSDTVAQLRRKPFASIAIRSEKEFTEPYVQKHVVGRVHEDRESTLKYLIPMRAQYFGTVQTPSSWCSPSGPT